jgi:hypothetical protein
MLQYLVMAETSGYSSIALARCAQYVRNYNAVSSRKRAIQEFRSLKLAQTHRVNVLYCIHAANTESHPVDLQVILNPDQSSSRLHFATVLIF